MTTIEFNKRAWLWRAWSSYFKFILVLDNENHHQSLWILSSFKNQFNTSKWVSEKVSYSALIWEIRCENWIRNPRKLQGPLYLAWPISISDLVSETFENTNECWQAPKLQDQHSKRLCCRQFSNLTISREGRDLDCLE